MTPTQQRVIDAARALDEVEKLLKECSEERLNLLREWEAEAERWKKEGDMYGWNFFQGMAGGANWCDIIYKRALRKLRELKDALDREEKQDVCECGHTRKQHCNAVGGDGKTECVIESCPCVNFSPKKG